MNDTPRRVQLGLRHNWRQFTLLVIVNAFVGGMVGMERTIFPQFAELTFGVASKTAILSFITAFGLSKALANYYTGRLANRYGRRNLLLWGWIIALPVPFLLMYAPSWSWVIAANVLLGLSQGLTWSSTVVMKIDLVGEKDRGFAMGLNEFAGYFAVGLVAFLTGWVAHTYGVTPYPFYIGIVLSVLGLAFTLLWVRDTRAFVQQESQAAAAAPQPLQNVFWATTLRDRTLSAVTQAGLINNLNDGMIWGLLPVLLFAQAYDADQVGIITAAYPTVWGIGQLFTGKMADHYPRKAMLFWGMLLQAIAILLLPFLQGFYPLAIVSALLGLGTALVYPTFLTTIAAATSPQQRAESIGTFRLWRDLGYAFGAVLSGIVADALGVPSAIWLIGALTFLSALIIKWRMPQPTISDACTSPAAVQAAWGKGAPLRLLDVRDATEYDAQHIPTAVHWPLAEISHRIAELPTGVHYVTVCGKGGGRSAEAAVLLRAAGHQATWLCGGTLGWPGDA